MPALHLIHPLKETLNYLKTDKKTLAFHYE